MKPSRSSSGYLHVQLYIDGKSFTKLIHQLVAEAFIENPDNKPDVNHIDGNKLNNNVSNLEWVTKSENIRHSLRTGLRVPPMLGVKGKDNPNSKPILQYSLEGKFVNIWASTSDASKWLKVNTASIRNAMSARHKTAGGFMWRRYGGGDIHMNIEPCPKRANKQYIHHHQLPRRWSPDKTKYGRIQQLTEDMILVKEWDCCMDAVNELHIPKQYIYDCLRGKRKSAAGFIWRPTYQFSIVRSSSVGAAVQSASSED